MISSTLALADPRPLVRFALSVRGIVIMLAVPVGISTLIVSIDSIELPDVLAELLGVVIILLPSLLIMLTVGSLIVSRKLKVRQYKCNVCRYQWQLVEERPDLVRSRLEWIEAELKSVRRRSNRKRLVQFLFSTGYLVSVEQDDWARGQALCEEALPLAEQDGDQKNLAYVLDNLGFVLTFRGEWARALPLLERAVALSRQIEEWRLYAISRGDLGLARLFLGQYEAARDDLEESLNFLQKMGDTESDTARFIEGMAGVAVGLAQPMRAATLAGAAKTWHERSGIVQSLTPYRYFQQTVNRIQADLDILNFEAAWQEGAKMTPLEVYQYATTILEPVG